MILNVNQIQIDQEFYNNFMQKMLDDHDILMCSTRSEGKYVVAEL